MHMYHTRIHGSQQFTEAQVTAHSHRTHSITSDHIAAPKPAMSTGVGESVAPVKDVKDTQPGNKATTRSQF